jgi:predicted DsbA family dithiol-disulfide isomerase
VERYGPGIHEHTRRAIEAADLTYNPPAIIPNSRKALEVTELARDRSLHQSVHDRLMQAYWSEAADIGDENVLLGLVADVGLDRAEAKAALDEHAYADRVDRSTREAQRHGIHAIPAFVLADRLLVLGAQPRELFESAVDQIDAASA